VEAAAMTAPTRVRRESFTVTPLCVDVGDDP
jgi:hypothetical protein